ncbi:MAG: type II secretion system F family protein [Burkholderiaceae bacterium]|nr:type II secretion system F family protein [Burkholderiaceae bacterium]
MNSWLTTLDKGMLLSLAAVSLGLAVFLIGWSLLRRVVRQGRSRLVVDRALAVRDLEHRVPPSDGENPVAGHMSAMMGMAATIGTRWRSGRYGALLLAAEDAELIEMAGYQDTRTAKAMFLFVRGVLCLAMPVGALLWLNQGRASGNPLVYGLILTFVGFALGWMLPKWIVRRRVQQRKQAVNQELPLLLDLLRLLQGVGLSVDQSLHVVVHEFAEVMPVLAAELNIAVEQHTRGRSREQSLARLSTGFDNEDLSAICRLIVQVDQHGGATQEPLKHFSERLREQRKLDLKERIGKLTVKMTGVMVLTLMPALLIITGGAGFLAIIRGLSRLGGG